MSIWKPRPAGGPRIPPQRGEAATKGWLEQGMVMMGGRIRFQQKLKDLKRFTTH